MNIGRAVQREATRDDRALDELADSMVEAAFRRNLLTRLVRTAGIMLATFVATTAFVQSAERERCEANKTFLRSYVEFGATAADARRQSAAEANTRREREADLETARAYDEQVNLLRPGIDTDCDERYPIIPLLGI